jgi:hypothetical protein
MGRSVELLTCCYCLCLCVAAVLPPRAPIAPLLGVDLLLRAGVGGVSGSWLVLASQGLLAWSNCLGKGLVFVAHFTRAYTEGHIQGVLWEHSTHRIHICTCLALSLMIRRCRVGELGPQGPLLHE